MLVSMYAHKGARQRGKDGREKMEKGMSVVEAGAGGGGGMIVYSRWTKNSVSLL